LVVQGGWFWIVLVVVCGALVFGLIGASSHVIRVRLARRKRREVLGWLHQHCARELLEGQITLVGRWCGDVIDAYGERIAVTGAEPLLVTPESIPENPCWFPTARLVRLQVSGATIAYVRFGSIATSRQSCTVRHQSPHPDTALHIRLFPRLERSHRIVRHPRRRKL
jgi:hypothetical protein